MGLPGALSNRIVDNLHDGVRFVGRPDFTTTYWNRGAELITGYAGQEIVGHSCTGQTPFHFDEKGHPLCDVCPFVEAIRKGKSCEKLLYVRHKSGDLVPVQSCIEPMKDETGAIVGAIEIFTDISWKFSALKRIEELNRLTLLDPLTYTGNRRYGEMAVNAKLEELRRYGRRFGMLFIDIDDFKSINDIYGHASGDDMLKLVARSMAKCLRSFDVLCRWGGDEFMGIIVNIHDQDQLTSLCKRLCYRVQRSALQIMEHSVSATVSIGATIAKYGDTMEDLLGRTDNYMLRSKQSGKNHFCVS